MSVFHIKVASFCYNHIATWVGIYSKMANVLEAVVSGVRALSALEESSQQEPQQMEENQSQNETAIDIDAVQVAKPPMEPPDVCWLNY